MKHQRALPAGTRIEEYQLKTVLGAGGFGITYRAHDTHLAKTVAIKEYLPVDFAMRTADSTVVPNSDADADDYAWGLRRFLDEARTLARFDHPHLNKVHRFFKANGTAYLVLDYVEGESLSAVLQRQGTLPPDELERLLTDVLSGLEAVHAARYVHRDVKPGNLMVRPDGSTVLLDFGAARQAIGQRSRSVTAILTPGYAPIEQYDSTAEDVGPWSDLYALGMVAYRCVSGVSDTELPDAVTRARNARKGLPDLRPAVEVGTGRYAEDILRGIDWAIQINEDERPQSVAAWRAQIAGPASSPADVRLTGRNTALIEAAYNGHTASVEALLAGGAQPDAQDENGYTALMCAASEGHTASVEALLAGGAQPDVQDKAGGTALMWAAYNGHTVSVEALLAGGAQPDVQDKYGYTALMAADVKGHTASVEALLAGGAQPDVQTKAGETALMWAAFEGHTASVEALLAGGAQPNVQNQNGQTALDRARSKGHTEIVRLLRAAGGR